MSRRSTRSTSGITASAIAEANPNPPAPAGSRDSSLKGKKRSIVEDGAQGIELPERTSKRSKKPNSRISGVDAPGQNGTRAVSIPDRGSPVDSKTQESSTAVTKKVAVSRTKKGDSSATATRERKVIETTRKRTSKLEDTEEKIKEEDEEKEVTVTKQKPIKGKKKGKGSEEMAVPLATRTTGLKMFVGAHVSAAQGIHNAVTNSLHVGGNAFALFLKSQRKWDNPPLQKEHRDEFRRLCAKNNYDASKYVLPHGSYLVNLAQEDPVKAKQAYTSFLDDLRRCEEVGIRLYNFHPGATNNTPLSSSLSRIASALTTALSATSTVIPVLETTCGHGTTIGSTISEFRALISLIPKEHHPRIGICLDTCHTFAAGYDLSTPSGWRAFMDEFDREVGAKFLKAVHLNDSKTPCGSKRDLHANIGTGFLGLRAFHNVMNEKKLEGVPMILETPIDRVVKDEDGEEGEAKAKGKGKVAASSKVKKPPTKPKTVEDKSIWAREIKLLESLIEMDPEGEVFKNLEASLAEEGREEREKHLEVHERKKKEREEAEKKKNKKGGKKGKGGGKGNKKKGDESESELSEVPSSP
ncbi:hypothetical protein FQN54_006789 [Arachnomyces sp. PD_36]|nr:hypothetical protein FQN54_006789 [Arachnomyces sp. PD_36]